MDANTFEGFISSFTAHKCHMITGSFYPNCEITAEKLNKRNKLLKVANQLLEMKTI